MRREIKKILLAIGYSKEFGGAQKVFIAYVKEFTNRGYEVIAVLPAGPLVDLIKQLNVKYYVLDDFSIRSFFTVEHILRKEKVDIINAQLSKCSLKFAVVNLFHRLPICCTFHNTIIHENTGKIKRVIYPFLYSLLAKMIDGIIVNSEHSKRHFEKIAGIHAKFMKVIYFGIELDKFINAPAPETRSNKFVIGTVGRLSAEKGHRYLIEALTYIKKMDFECLIVGDGPERSKLENQVKNNGLQGKVKFLGFKNNVEQYMNRMDVIIIPSVDEAFGIAIIEAFALKKLVIASEAGGIPELVKHGETGLLFPVRDSSALAERIRYSCNNRQKAEKMGRNAYDFIVRNITSSSMADNTLAYYDLLIKSHVRTN